jgi:hypothetical protein
MLKTILVLATILATLGCSENFVTKSLIVPGQSSGNQKPQEQPPSVPPAAPAAPAPSAAKPSETITVKCVIGEGDKPAGAEAEFQIPVWISANTTGESVKFSDKKTLTQNGASAEITVNLLAPSAPSESSQATGSSYLLEVRFAKSGSAFPTEPNSSTTTGAHGFLATSTDLNVAVLCKEVPNSEQPVQPVPKN